MSDDPVKPPRFPYVAALLCVACVGAAAWTWMRYSFCWHVTRQQLRRATETRFEAEWLDGRYIALHGVFEGKVTVRRSKYMISSDHVNYCVLALGEDAGSREFAFLQVPAEPLPDPSIAAAARRCPPIPTGRVDLWNLDVGVERCLFGIDTMGSRFTGASSAGLVVGAMGVFVFTVALRHWLGERRTFREEARA